MHEVVVLIEVEDSGNPAALVQEMAGLAGVFEVGFAEGSATD